VAGQAPVAVPTRDELLRAFAAAQAEFEELVARLRPEDEERPLGPGLWTVRQTIAHIAQVEATHLMLARWARRGLSLRAPRPLVPLVVKVSNAFSVFRVRNKGVAELLERQRRSRRACVRFLEASTDADLGRPCFRFDTASWSPLGNFLAHAAYHQTEHTRVVDRALVGVAPLSHSDAADGGPRGTTHERSDQVEHA
jgi:hypothetical protein